MKKLFDYIATILCVVFLGYVLVNGVNINNDVKIYDYTPEFELREFPLQSVFLLSSDFGSGSGVLIAPNKILTAAHVIDDCGFIGFIRVFSHRFDISFFCNI